MTNNMSHIFSWVIAFAMGPSALTYGLWRVHKKLRARKWMPTEAIVNRSELFQDGPYRCVPIIEFEYNYLGSTFYGKADLFTKGTHASADLIIAKLPRGSKISILVDPDNPQNSCFEASITPEAWFFILLGMASIAASAVLMTSNVPEYLRVFY
jgi:hypothetical protein